MIFTVGELRAALDDPGDDAPVFVSHDPQGGREAAQLIEVVTEHWRDTETKELVETVVIYPA